MSHPPPKAILLDVNGTLFPIHAAEGAFKQLGVDPDLIDLWFARVLRDAFAAQLCGVFAPFTDFAGHHLAQLSPYDDTTPEAASQAIAEAFSSAIPYPDVGPCLVKLQLAGIQIAALTNGSVNITKSVLTRAGVSVSPSNTSSILSPPVDVDGIYTTSNNNQEDTVKIFDITEPMAWKPSSTAYEYAANALLLAKNEIMMVSSHPWDVHGALQAGMQAAYVTQRSSQSGQSNGGCVGDTGGEYPKFLDKPTLIVPNFDVLVDRLLGFGVGRNSDDGDVGGGGGSSD